MVSVRMNLLLRSELEYTNMTEWFWTDSSVVLGYIANNTRRFHAFVANRVQQIRIVSEPYQWNYVSSSDNPADIASRGASADDFVNNCRWFQDLISCGLKTLSRIILIFLMMIRK